MIDDITYQYILITENIDRAAPSIARKFNIDEAIVKTLHDQCNPSPNDLQMTSYIVSQYIKNPFDLSETAVIKSALARFLELKNNPNFEGNKNIMAYTLEQEGDNSLFTVLQANQKVDKTFGQKANDGMQLVDQKTLHGKEVKLWKLTNVEAMNKNLQKSKKCLGKWCVKDFTAWGPQRMRDGTIPVEFYLIEIAGHYEFLFDFESKQFKDKHDIPVQYNQIAPYTEILESVANRFSLSSDQQALVFALYPDKIDEYFVSSLADISSPRVLAQHLNSLEKNIGDIKLSQLLQKHIGTILDTVDGDVTEVISKYIVDASALTKIVTLRPLSDSVISALLKYFATEEADIQHAVDTVNSISPNNVQLMAKEYAEDLSTDRNPVVNPINLANKLEQLPGEVSTAIVERLGKDLFEVYQSIPVTIQISGNNKFPATSIDSNAYAILVGELKRYLIPYRVKVNEHIQKNQKLMAEVQSASLLQYILTPGLLDVLPKKARGAMFKQHASRYMTPIINTTTDKTEFANHLLEVYCLSFYTRHVRRYDEVHEALKRNIFALAAASILDIRVPILKSNSSIIAHEIRDIPTDLPAVFYSLGSSEQLDCLHDTLLMYGYDENLTYTQKKEFNEFCGTFFPTLFSRERAPKELIDLLQFGHVDYYVYQNLVVQGGENEATASNIKAAYDEKAKEDPFFFSNLIRNIPEEALRTKQSIPYFVQILWYRNYGTDTKDMDQGLKQIDQSDSVVNMVQQAHELLWNAGLNIFKYASVLKKHVRDGARLGLFEISGEMGNEKVFVINPILKSK